MKTYTLWQNIDIKIIAILRGITPDQIPEIIPSLIRSGIRIIEIPLNSPNPIKSIETAVKLVKDITSDQCLIGAGTVLNVQEVEQVKEVGGNIIVSPNVCPKVIKSTIVNDMLSFPGVFTPTEALAALQNGAHGLKFFPASTLNPEGIKALKAILPYSTPICVVGGVSPENFTEYYKAGATSFGLGTWLYTPSMIAKEVEERSSQAVQEFTYMLQ